MNILPSVNHKITLTLSLISVSFLALACDRRELDPVEQAPKSSLSDSQNPPAGQNSQVGMGEVPTENPEATYTLAQVATHNKAADCWIILDAKVYNVTEFISEHPGGARALSTRCGTDASAVFARVGHSDAALAIREKYFVGDLSQ